MEPPSNQRLDLFTVIIAISVFAACCDRAGDPTPSNEATASNAVASSAKQATTVPTDTPRFAELRARMVKQQLAGRDIQDSRVLAALAKVPRHLFVPESLLSRAYADSPLPIGLEQTISQPYVVAFMTQTLQLNGNERVLEIGTGSGYQAAVLAEVCREVYSIEIVAPLSKRASRVLKRIGYENIHLKIGDGYRGWPEKAPFDAIMVTAAPREVPQPLIDQLAEGGRLILPVGDLYQDLVLIEKRGGRIQRSKVLPVRFVPMTGEAEKQR